MNKDRKYSSYYSYIEHVVNKCSHKWLIFEKEEFKNYRIAKFAGSPEDRPGGKLVKIFPARCKSYSCPICGKKKVLDLVDRLKGVNLKGYRFFTLTLKSGNDLDATEKNLELLTSSFNTLNKKLRKDPKFKNLEYFRVVEIGKKSGMVHMHGLWNIYLPIGKLSRMWSEITGGSYRVDLKRIPNRSDVIEYMLKYLTKDISQTDMQTDPALLNLDLKNTAAIFYENGKRRWQASRNFFNKKQTKKTSGFIPFYYESEDNRTVESVIGYLVKEYDLKKDHFDLEAYHESDLYLQNLFYPDG